MWFLAIWWPFWIHANISVIPKTISLDFDTELTKDPYNWKISQKFLLQFFIGKASIFGSLTLLYAKNLKDVTKELKKLDLTCVTRVFFFKKIKYNHFTCLNKINAHQNNLTLIFPILIRGFSKLKVVKMKIKTKKRKNGFLLLYCFISLTFL